MCIFVVLLYTTQTHTVLPYVCCPAMVAWLGPARTVFFVVDGLSKPPPLPLYFVPWPFLISLLLISLRHSPRQAKITYNEDKTTTRSASNTVQTGAPPPPPHLRVCVSSRPPPPLTYARVADASDIFNTLFYAPQTDVLGLDADGQVTPWIRHAGPAIVLDDGPSLDGGAAQYYVFSLSSREVAEVPKSGCRSVGWRATRYTGEGIAAPSKWRADSGRPAPGRGGPGRPPAIDPRHVESQCIARLLFSYMHIFVHAYTTLVCAYI